MISLKLKTDDHELIFDIRKNNTLLIRNYESYITFYNTFYKNYFLKVKDSLIELSNIPLNNKNSIFIDLTTINSILTNLMYKKDTLLFYYVNNKFKTIVDNYSNLIDNNYLDFISNINEEDKELTFQSNDSISKNLLNYLDISYDINNYKSIIVKLIEYYLSNNKEKILIFFINCEIIEFNYEHYDNIYTFDIGKNNNYKNINFIFDKEIINYDYISLNNSLINKIPFDMNDIDINKSLESYYKYYIYLDEIIVIDKEEYIFAYLINKILNIKQNLLPKNFIIDDKFIEYLSNI